MQVIINTAPRFEKLHKGHYEAITRYTAVRFQAPKTMHIRDLPSMPRGVLADVTIMV
jgi:hypothetical protein